MRKRTLQLVVTFATTTAAMAMEQTALSAALPGRIIPLPTEISAGCGIAWKAPLTEKAAIQHFLEEHGLAWEMMFELELY